MNIYWKSAVTSGSFTSAGNWVQGVVPGAGDVAELTTSGVLATVGFPDTVLGLNVVSGARLIVTTSAFTATEGTATGANHGFIVVAGGTGGQLNFGGTFNTPGTVSAFTGRPHPVAILSGRFQVPEGRPLESELHWEGINQDDSDELAGVGLRRGARSAPKDVSQHRISGGHSSV